MLCKLKFSSDDRQSILRMRAGRLNKFSLACLTMALVRVQTVEYWFMLHRITWELYHNQLVME